MSIVGIQAWRSALEDSAPVEVPDLRVPEKRDRYRDDQFSPDPARDAEGRPPSSVLREVVVGASARRLAESIWSK